MVIIPTNNISTLFVLFKASSFLRQGSVNNKQHSNVHFNHKVRKNNKFLKKRTKLFKIEHCPYQPIKTPTNHGSLWPMANIDEATKQQQQKRTKSRLKHALNKGGRLTNQVRSWNTGNDWFYDIIATPTSSFDQ